MKLAKSDIMQPFNMQKIERNNFSFTVKVIWWFCFILSQPKWYPSHSVIIYMPIGGPKGFYSYQQNWSLHNFTWLAQIPNNYSKIVCCFFDILFEYFLGRGKIALSPQTLKLIGVNGWFPKLWGYSRKLSTFIPIGSVVHCPNSLLRHYDFPFLGSFIMPFG